MKAYHICYHTDEDGLASAAVIYEYLKIINKDNKKNIRYIFHKIDYTMDIRTIISDSIPAGDEIYFVDYSFSRFDNLKYILSLSKKGIKVKWIDHHQTSKDTINSRLINWTDYPNFYYFIDTKYCGAYLCYVYAWSHINECLVPTKLVFELYDIEIPLYIKYVNSWDTWKHNMPNTMEFNIGLRTQKRTPKSVFSSILNYNNNLVNKIFSTKTEDIKTIEKCMRRYINNIISYGKIIKQYQDIENESFCNENGFEFNIIDKTSETGRIKYRCFAINKRGNSMMFGDKINQYDIVIGFNFNGKMYVNSLYTANDDVHCDVLAKKFGTIDRLGGGGHQKAAGFQVYKPLFKANCDIYINSKFFNKDKYFIRIVSHGK